MSIKDNIKEKEILYSITGCIILAICYGIQHIKSGFYYIPAVHVILCVLYIIFALFTGKKYLYIYLFIYSITTLFFSRFTEYTSFIMILICIYLKPIVKYPYILIYIICVIARLCYCNDTYSHAIIHGVSCGFLYCGYLMLTRNKLNTRLSLTPVEEKILNQIISGKEKWDIPGYTEVTVYRKLKNARIKNNCETNDELIEKYRDSQKIEKDSK